MNSGPAGPPFDRPAGACPGRALRRLAASVGAVLAALVLAGGCAPLDAGKSLTPIADWAAFQREVLQSSRPVLIELSKDPCPPCVVQKAELDKLADEFSGQVFFATMTLMKGPFVSLCPEVRDRYHIYWVPTTLLFVNGEVQKRWESMHPAGEIREGIKEALRKSALPSVSAVTGPTP